MPERLMTRYWKGLNLIDVHITMHDGIDGEGTDTFHTELLGDIFAMADDRR